MSPEFIALIIIVVFVVLLVMRLPVAFCLIGLSTMFMLLFLDPRMLHSVYSGAVDVATKDIYVAVPTFAFMAAVLQFSGIAERLHDMMYKWFAGLRGGLAIGTIAICTLIAAITGIGATGIVTAGLLAYPEMTKRGYDRSISLGCIMAGGALGPLIPPSVIMIIVGGFAKVSIGKLFTGGVFPGLLMSFLFILYIGARFFLRSELAPALQLEERATWKERFVSLRWVVAPIILIFAVLGGIYSGACTPSEAGGVGAFGALVCAAIYRQINWGALKEAAMITLRTVCMVMWLFIGGICFSILMSMTGVTYFISDTIASMAVSPMVILSMMMIITLIMGMFIDGYAISMICLPIFIPVVSQLDIDLLWFCLLFSINVIIGYITPPFGMNLSYLKEIVPPNIKIEDIYRSALPWVVLMLIVLTASILFSPLLTWLPSTMK